MNRIKGNIVTTDQTMFGEICWNGSCIEEVILKENIQPDEPWILPGFIDMHLHGAGSCTVEGGEKDLRGMAEFLSSKGVSRFLPTYACAPHEEMLDFVKTVRKLALAPSGGGALITGSHLEGPWLSPRFCGGMIPGMIRPPDIAQAQEFVDAAAGTLKLMTIAPEGPEALEVIKFLHKNNVILSTGHSGCPPAFLETAVQAGIRQVCHLFDCYELPESCSGVRQAALTDLVLIHDGLMKEIIMDGLHVPRDLVILARRAAGADHIIAITDAMQGAGLEEGHFSDCGEPYTIRAGDVARRDRDNAIVGSSLTMERAFYNMTVEFGFTEKEAMLALSANPAKQLKISHMTGTLETGKNADITVIAPDRLTVEATFINGEKVY